MRVVSTIPNEDTCKNVHIGKGEFIQPDRLFETAHGSVLLKVRGLNSLGYVFVWLNTFGNGSRPIGVSTYVDAKFGRYLPQGSKVTIEQ